VLYDGQKVGESRLDFLIEDELVLEIKAVESLSPLFRAQVISYLKANRPKARASCKLQRQKAG
jgi:GxxExxY protein